MPFEPIFFNDQWSPLDKTSVSPLDRGYLFGDGIYEVIPCYEGKPFRLTDHLQRLANGLRFVEIDNPYTDEQWHKLVQQAINNRQTKDCIVYLQVTRGTQEARDFFITDTLSSPQVLLYSDAFKPLSIEQIVKGIKVCTMDDPRWKHCSIKTTNLLGSVLARIKAKKMGCDDTVYIRDGLLTESAASNVFVIIDDQIVTPPLNDNILPGITRKVLIELFEANKLPFQERPIKAEELPKVQALWLSASKAELSPVYQIDDQTLPTKHPLFLQILEAFKKQTTA